MSKLSKLAKSTAVAVALTPAAAFAAVDDQGMQYVSAAEGLNGSMRVFIMESVDGENSDTKDNQLGKNDSLRLWYNGSLDLGGGMESVYYWEIRDNVGDSGGVGTHAWDLGVRGSFGTFSFGRLGMVAPRMVPGGSLETVYDNSRASFASDPGDNGIRYESPRFNGFQVGVSATGLANSYSEEFTYATNTDGTARTSATGTSEENWLSEWSMAANYQSPIGLEIGFGYEVNFTDVEESKLPSDRYDDQSGWRVGARFVRDIWTAGYEYRNYDGFNAFVLPGFTFGSSGNTPISSRQYVLVGDAEIDLSNLPASLAPSLATTIVPASSLPAVGDQGRLVYDGFKALSYDVHAFAVRVSLDRITASAQYSIESQSLDLQNTSGTARATDLDRKTLAMDVAYELGSRSLIGIGFQTQERDDYLRVTNANTEFAEGATLPARYSIRVSDKGPSVDSSKVGVYYRVDF